MIEALIEAARKARQRASAPHSGFQVGAALLVHSKTIVTGCNIESASYGLTICAERVALFKAVADGHRKFEAIAIIADSSQFTTPCGACRQIIWEFCGDIPVIAADLSGNYRQFRSGELLPVPFDRSQLR